MRQGVSWNLHNGTNWANGVYFTLGAASQRALESLQFAALTFERLIDGRRDWQPQPDAATSIQPRLQTESPITAKLSWTAIAVVTAAADAQRVLLKVNGEMLHFVLPTRPNFQVAKPQRRSDQTCGILLLSFTFYCVIISTVTFSIIVPLMMGCCLISTVPKIYEHFC